MGLDIALKDAMTGLRATQAQIQVISANIANAQTPGYSEQTITQTPIRMPAGGAGVQTSIIQRISDQLLTTTLARQSSASAGAPLRACRSSRRPRTTRARVGLRAVRRALNDPTPVNR